MASRLLVCVLAFGIVGAPVAADVCHVMCASHPVDATHGRTDRHACAPSSPALGTLMSAVPHACGHQSEEPVGVEHAFHTLAAPPGLVEVVAIASFDIVVVQALALDISGRPAGRPNPVRPLRV